MSTLGVPYSRALEERHKAAGRRYLAAPVFGRPEAAASRALRIVVAGEARDVEEARPILSALGQEVHVVGERPHQAHAVKLGGNFLIAAMLEALSEAYVLVEKNGVKREAFYEVVRAFFRSPVYENYGRILWSGALRLRALLCALGSRTCASSTRRRTPPTPPCPLPTCFWTGCWRGWPGGWGRRTGPPSLSSPRPTEVWRDRSHGVPQDPGALRHGGDGGLRLRRGGNPRGLTANAFMSVSLDPPLVLVSLDNRSRTKPVLERAGRYGVSVLAEEQRALSDHFAGRPQEGLEIAFEERAGVPLLKGALAQVAARVVAVYPGGTTPSSWGRWSTSPGGKGGPSSTTRAGTAGWESGVKCGLGRKRR